MEDNELTQQIIGCAIEVHRGLGPGLLESAYQSALAIEFAHARLQVERERVIPAEYRGVRIGDYRPDFIVEKRVVVELKCVVKWEPVFTAQMLTYLRLTGIHIGLALNFHRAVIRDGIHRFVL